MKKISLLLLMLLLAAALAAPSLATTKAPGISPGEALRLLKAGNSRYVDGKLQHPHQDRARRALTAGPGAAPPGSNPHLFRLPDAAGNHLRPGHRRYLCGPGGRQRCGHG